MIGAPVVVVLAAARAEPLARRIKGALPQAEIHAPDCAACPADLRFGKATSHIAGLFAASRPIIGVCAAGILIRAVAPLLADKRQEPPVLAVAEDGRWVVPLLGGHRGGNELARRIAEAIGAACAMTTAGDLRLGVALDDPPPGWRLASGGDAKAVMARLLGGESARLDVEAGGAAWLEASAISRSDDARLRLLVTHRAAPSAPDTLVYHPAVLAVGIGSERDAPREELLELIEAALAGAGLAGEAVAGLFSIDLKMAEPALLEAAQRLRRPARFFDAAELAAETGRLADPSERVRVAVGAPSVAEAAALRAAGPASRLVVPKRKSRHCTCAVALAPGPIDVERVGRRRGRLSVVGVGPGDADSRTAAVSERLRRAEDVVGYEPYLDLVGDLTARAERHAFQLGEEAERCRHALRRASEGREVALVCSGDPGIYAMAPLVVELAESDAEPGWRRVEIEFLPGVSALQAAAARVGAAIGHDFCAISLSDLLTPMEVIEDRLRAAARADFVVALYNPVSSRRRAGLARAREILLAERPPDTAVVVARNLGRAGETVRVLALGDLDAAMVDMVTLVLVGARATRRVSRLDGRDLVLTPRGYSLA